MAKLSERNWAVGIHTLERPGVTAGDDGAEASVTRVGWETLSGLVAKIRIMLIFTDKTVSISADLQGGPLVGKDGLPLTENRLAWDWPGEWQNGVRHAQRPDTLRMEFEVFQPCRSAIEIDAVRYSSPGAQTRKTG